MATSGDSHLPGHPLHLIRRGLLRGRCFFTEADRVGFLDALARGAKAEGCVVHAYVLMQNHVHLLVTPSRTRSVARLMASLASPLWEPRFEAWPVYSRRYVLECMRYIELNPVRARIVSRPGEYRWSSYGANALGDDDALVTPHSAYCLLGRSTGARRAAYRAGFRSYAPRAMSRTRAASGGASSARQATWPSGRTSTSRRS
jgi:putative transposase